ncbi:isoflavone reductase family [Fusarium phyllophilum]|uniref:Isoflavone reductase family n=1 Tax=Fusarium phyllophilum TaxID=47803 RepID=A0A8H5MVQ7_9HYPO|nr:isoflavone reductase family [Fusarium phyllophilum]
MSKGQVKNVIFLGVSTLQELILPFSAKNLIIWKWATLSRKDSAAKFPADIKVIRTDSTAASLENALAGQDVIISMLGDAGLHLQKSIVDAAIVAGVERIFPSEFGCRTYIDKVVELMPYFQQKRDMISYLRTKQDRISWTAMIPNPFFDEEILAAVEKSSGRTFERHYMNSTDLYEDALRRFRSRGPGDEKDLLAERDIIQCITYGKGEFLGLSDVRDGNDWTESLEEDVKGVLEGTRP